MLSLERKDSFYWTRIARPFMLINAIGCLPHALNGYTRWDSFEKVQVYLALVILASFTWFSSRELRPVLPYPTLLDSYCSGCMFWIGLLLLESVLVPSDLNTSFVNGLPDIPILGKEI